ncbi:alpha/beta hydrolase [Waterburya agarophytonicola K14]|uniref:Alpha/beta hydrolase n=1 Tax=Waterburya agarophytonicola KI4 TaxID=2874699 RepID=A0A964BW95_9CYAN|nr:alpha/beta hydrolase [Waterburya agarophytonicola]MCC0178760.1 alpha/beta hydrolase [Waterburya agarophytonicola KI4]
MPNKLKLWSYLAIGAFQISLSASLLGYWAKKAVGAENIILNYGALEFSVSVDSLETYATTGELEGSLKSYAGFLTPEQLEQLKVGLITNADFSHLAIAQFLYSYQGETILDRVSKVIKTQARQPGFYAVRAALILAAANEEEGGLTPLNVLKSFPTNTLRIDSRQGFELFKNLSRVVQKNNQGIAAVEQTARQERQNKATATPGVRDLNLLIPGKYRYKKQALIMKDVKRKYPSGKIRDRIFPVDLYLPKTKTPQHLPLIVISHGLGSDLTTFAYLAKHLASHGFAVAVPEHPGSSASQIESLLTGLDSDVTPPQELIDRPLDIQFLLDKLAQDYSSEIDTNNVGIIGQSFGAYTALAIAGAELNWSTLEKDCDNIQNSWNLSLLIQCLALQIPDADAEIELQDRRIKAAIAINPLTSSIFGQKNISKIDIPITIVSGSSDPITPALSEQIIPFTWLNNPEKYLVLLKKGTHFSTLNESAGSIPVPEKAIGPDPKIAQAYIKQLGLAFFGTYIQKKAKYSSYLNAEYGDVISKRKMPLSLIESLDPELLKLK